MNNRHLHRIFAGLLMTTAFASCARWTAAPNNVPCTTILDSRLTTLVRSIDRAQVGAWIRRTYTEGQMTQVADGPDYYWRDGGRSYSAHFGRRIARANYDLEPQVRISNVLTCFGNPDYYRLYTILGADYSGSGVELWYVDAGYIFGYDAIGLNAQDTYDADSALNRVEVAGSGTVKDWVGSM